MAESGIKDFILKQKQLADNLLEKQQHIWPFLADCLPVISNPSEIRFPLMKQFPYDTNSSQNNTNTNPNWWEKHIDYSPLPRVQPLRLESFRKAKEGQSLLTISLQVHGSGKTSDVYNLRFDNYVFCHDVTCQKNSSRVNGVRDKAFSEAVFSVNNDWDSILHGFNILYVSDLIYLRLWRQVEKALDLKSATNLFMYSYYNGEGTALIRVNIIRSLRQYKFPLVEPFTQWLHEEGLIGKVIFFFDELYMLAEKSYGTYIEPEDPTEAKGVMHIFARSLLEWNLHFKFFAATTTFKNLGIINPSLSAFKASDVAFIQSKPIPPQNWAKNIFEHYFPKLKLSNANRWYVRPRHIIEHLMQNFLAVSKNLKSSQAQEVLDKTEELSFREVISICYNDIQCAWKHAQKKSWSETNQQTALLNFVETLSISNTDGLITPLEEISGVVADALMLDGIGFLEQESKSITFCEIPMQCALRVFMFEHSLDTCPIMATLLKRLRANNQADQTGSLFERFIALILLWAGFSKVKLKSIPWFDHAVKADKSLGECRIEVIHFASQLQMPLSQFNSKPQPYWGYFDGSAGCGQADILFWVNNPDNQRFKKVKLQMKNIKDWPKAKNRCSTAKIVKQIMASTIEEENSDWSQVGIVISRDIRTKWKHKWLRIKNTQENRKDLQNAFVHSCDIERKTNGFDKYIQELSQKIKPLEHNLMVKHLMKICLKEQDLLIASALSKPVMTQSSSSSKRDQDQGKEDSDFEEKKPWMRKQKNNEGTATMTLNTSITRSSRSVTELAKQASPAVAPDDPHTPTKTRTAIVAIQDEFSHLGEKEAEKRRKEKAQKKRKRVEDYDDE
eukprot:TRINITY_DN7504_c0_g1_i1.p1 TRINITY_DN7504_c0_g1~~TRINITY_DN7504_c0_g1_i1.p1  ORF type:complete len:844 (-),score=147.86 TRINITY_DN7504_c0_g1_i1:18-2549(-)